MEDTANILKQQQLDIQDQFNIYESSESITIIFSSTMENIDRACEETTRFLIELFKRADFIDYSELKSHLFAIQLVMREGLTNAVRHGNCLNISKTVRCFVKIADQILLVEIEDQGRGFNWRKEQSKDINDIDDDLDHGRGLMIMEQYFSRYWYNDIGNKLTLEKHISLEQQN